MKYGQYATGRRYRYSKGSPRQYACISCGGWLAGADNYGFTCSECRNTAIKADQAKEKQRADVQVLR